MGVTATPTAGKALGQDHPLANPFTLSDFQVHGQAPGLSVAIMGWTVSPLDSQVEALTLRTSEWTIFGVKAF